MSNPVLFIQRAWRAFTAHARAASLMEYSFVVGLIALASIVAIGQTGGGVRDVLCVAKDRVQYYAFDAEPTCNIDIAEQPAPPIETPPDEGNGEDESVEEPPLAEDLIFDTTGLFFPNVVLPANTTARQDILTQFAGEYNTDVEYRVRRLTGSTVLDTPLSTAIRTNDTNEVQLLASATNTGSWTPWVALATNDTTHIGLQMTPPSSTAASLAGYYEVSLRPIGHSSLAETFSFSVTREGGDVLFDPILEVSDISLEIGDTTLQNIGFPLKGVMNTDVVVRMRQISGDGMTNARGFSQDKNNPVFYVNLVFQNNDYSAGQTLKPSAITNLGLRLQPTSDLFVDAIGTYAIEIAPVGMPDLAKTFTFTVSRPAGTVVFEPQLQVRNVLLPEGTTSQQVIIFPLSGNMNTSMRVQMRRVDATNADHDFGASGSSPQAYTLPSGLRMTDDALSKGITIQPTQPGLGIRFDPIDNIFLASGGSYEIHLSSTANPDDVRVYEFSVTRARSNIAFEPSFAVNNVVLPENTTTAQTILFPLTGTMNTNLLVSMTRANATGMTDNTTFMRSATLSGESPSTLKGLVGNGQTMQTTTTPANAKWLGIRVTPSADRFVESSAEYTIHIASAENPTDVRSYTFSIARPAVEMQFNPQLSIQDTTLAEGLNATEDVLFDVTGPMNTDVLIETRVTDSANITTTNTPWTRAQLTTGSVTSGTSVAAGGWSTLTRAGNTLSKIGVRFPIMTGRTYHDAFATYEIRLSSVNDPTDVRTYTVTVTRPGIDIVFNPQVAVSNTELPLGATGAQTVLFDVTGEMNTNVLFEVRLMDSVNVTRSNYNWPRVQTPTGTVNSGSSSLPGQWATTTRVGNEVAKIGVLVPIDTKSVYQNVTANYEMRLSSVENPSDVRTYAFTVTRPATPVQFDPSLNVQNVVLDTKAIGLSSVMFDFTGSSNANILVEARYLPANSVNMERANSSTLILHTPTSTNVSGNLETAGNWSSKTHAPNDINKIGVRVNVSATEVQASTGYYEIRLSSTENPSLTKTYAFSVTKPAGAIVFEPIMPVADRIIASGVTTVQDILFDIAGEMNTDIRFRARMISAENVSPSFALTYVSANGSTSNGIRAGTTTGVWVGERVISVNNPPVKLGIRFYPSTNTSLLSRATYEIEIAPTADLTKARTYQFTVTRPAQ